MDERVEERLHDLKASGRPPQEALAGLGKVLAKAWDSESFGSLGPRPRHRRFRDRAHRTAHSRSPARDPGAHHPAFGRRILALARGLSSAPLSEERVSVRPAEAKELHTRLLKCALEMPDARGLAPRAGRRRLCKSHRGFRTVRFGARSLARVKVLVANFRVRFDVYPAALRVLSEWTDMEPDTRRLICHWHVQLADPLYRAFTGDYLAVRRLGPRPAVSRDLVVAWVGQEGIPRWSLATRIQFASKLLSTAFSAGLVGSNKDPRPLLLPQVSDDALTYLLYLLREVEFSGTLLDNPYLASVGLGGSILEERLRGLSALSFRRQGDLVDFGWSFPDLAAWASSAVHPPHPVAAGGRS